MGGICAQADQDRVGAGGTLRTMTSIHSQRRSTQPNAINAPIMTGWCSM